MYCDAPLFAGTESQYIVTHMLELLGEPPAQPFASGRFYDRYQHLVTPDSRFVAMACSIARSFIVLWVARSASALATDLAKRVDSPDEDFTFFLGSLLSWDPGELAVPCVPFFLFLTSTFFFFVFFFFFFFPSFPSFYYFRTQARSGDGIATSVLGAVVSVPVSARRRV